ncbi:hypothetical protein Tco_1544942, partial [Tanacetum coccineum]
PLDIGSGTSLHGTKTASVRATPAGSTQNKRRIDYIPGPELNYTPMEKLVLSLVFAAKRLQRAATKVEHNIMYRPRTSVKGQILMDFLVEKSDENSLDTPVMETPPKPYTLFTDGSSCVDRSGAKYEALIAGLRIVAQMGVQNVQVLVEILKEKCIQEEEVVTVIEEEETT